MHRFHLLSALLACCAALFAQAPMPGTTKDDDAVLREGPKDPFTGGDAKWMKALGIEAYAPLPWGDGLRSEDVEKALGAGRFVWLETAHFRICCSLGAIGAPEEPGARKLLNAELAKLNKRCSKVPARASKLTAWLRAHLAAHRAEELYAEIADLVGFDASTGTHLGQKDKFLLVLFQKKSDLARYLDLFLGQQSTASQRQMHGKSGQRVVVMTAEGDEGPRDEASLHAQFRYLVVQMLLESGVRAPYWLANGLAHHYERMVPCNLMMTAPKDDEHVDEATQNKWHMKVRKRIQHEELVVPFTQLATMTDFGYQGTIQAWSRVDWLMQQDRRKLGEFLRGLQNGTGSANQIRQLEAVYGLSPEQFDQQWRAWVQKNYK